MVLDECIPYPCERRKVEQSVERTLRWAKRCRSEYDKLGLPQTGVLAFGIVQGGCYPDIRAGCARRARGARLPRVRDRRGERRRARAANARTGRSVGGGPAARKAALRHGRRDAPAASENDSPRRRHVRLRDAHAPRPPRGGFHPRRADKPQKREVRGGRFAARRRDGPGIRRNFRART